MEEESKEALSSFEDALRNLINNYCKENNSNTPDFILAKYVERQLDTLTTLILERDKWRLNEAEALFDIENDKELRKPLPKPRITT